MRNLTKLEAIAFLGDLVCQLDYDMYKEIFIHQDEDSDEEIESLLSIMEEHFDVSFL